MKKYTIIVLLACVNFLFSANRVVYIVPFSGMTNQNFFNMAARDDCHKCFCDLRDAFSAIGYRLELFDINTQVRGNEHILVYNVPVHPALWNKLTKLNKHNLTLFTWEPAVVLPNNFNRNIHRFFERVHTWFDDLIDNAHYFKFYYPQPKLEIIVDSVDFNSKKFAVMIAGNKNSRQPNELYSQRKRAIQFFEKNHPREFDLYGIGWEGFPSYRGKVSTKAECLKNYKFCICYENAYENGWITEKIFDSFVAGCVPVYWGARNITEYIPKHCYIDRRNFASDEQMYTFLKNMDEPTYRSYIESIKAYLASDLSFPFSIEYFIDKTIQIIEPHYDRTRIFNAEQIRKLNAIET